MALDTPDAMDTPGARRLATGRLAILLFACAPNRLRSIAREGAEPGRQRRFRRARHDVALRLEAVMEGVLVTGTARASAEGECVRCLEPVELSLDVDFQEMFSYPDSVRWQGSLVLRGSTHLTMTSSWRLACP